MYVLLYLHRANVWVEGGEDYLPVPAVLEHRLQHLVDEQVHLHHLLLFLPTVLNKLHLFRPHKLNNLAGSDCVHFYNKKCDENFLAQMFLNL